MELEHRVIKLELRVDNHEEDLKKLTNISESLRSSLVSIEKTLAQIKWLAAGAIIAIFGQAMGIEKILKLFL
jgi:uncharacterized coiled-coil protein SlyX